MNCGQMKCALRRFDGHGTKTDCRSNAEKSASIKEFELNMKKLMMDRQNLDMYYAHTQAQTQTNDVHKKN